MKIKGAFPVRWAAQNGNDGKGVTIVKTEIKYAVSTSGTTKPSSGWQTTIPSVSEGNYLWTWTHVEYSDGTKTDAYTTARQGIDGKGINSSQVTYSLQKSNVNPESITNWGSFPSELTDGYWLYTRTVITYSEGDTTTSYSVSQVGVGSYYAGVEEYYEAGESATEAPSGAEEQGTYPSVYPIQTTWKQDRPKLNASTPYLWNFEISSDSRGNRYVTAPRCIGNFAKGIVSIVETYAISAQGSVPEGRDYPSDIAEKDWTDEHFAAPPTNEKPYQWNKTVTTYNDGSKDTIYHVSAVKGADGKGAIYIDLDNENDSMMYDGSGNRVSGSMVSNIKLYDNGKDVTSGRTFSIDSSSGVSGSISGSTLTVTGMAANSGYVIVKCIYNSVPYYARFTCKKIIGTDKYEIVCTPSAIIINDDTDTESQVTVTIQVYKTAQNGTRSLLLNLPKGYLLVRKSQDIQTTGTSIPYSNGNATFKPDKNLSNRYRIELLDAGKNVLDYETIPINHTKNGEDACYYKLSPSLDALSFARNSDGGYAPSSIDIYCGYIKVVGSSRTAYAGNNVDNVWKIDGKYEIMWRYHRTDGTVSGWDWNKDSSNATITVYGLSSNTAIEFIFTSAESISYVDDSNIFDRVIVPIIREGAKGYSGAKPYFLKFSEIKGKEVKVYQGVGDEEWYTIVYDDVENTGWYTPKSTHITETNEELTDAKWLKSNMNFVATSVFFAQMAYIENLGVRNVLLSDGSTIEGGMCHSDVDENGASLGLGDVRFWLGSSNPTEGKIRGYRDGTFVVAGGKAVFDKDGNTTIANLTATNGNFTGVVNATSGSFTGEVNATSGKFDGELQSIKGMIGGFKLSYGGMEAVGPTGETLYLSPELLNFYNKSKNTDVRIGDDTNPSFLGIDSRCPMNVTINGERDNDGTPRCFTGIYINVKGASAYDNTVGSGNHALHLEHGDVLGLRPSVRRVSSSTNISSLDFTIFIVGSNTVTLTLTSTPEDGEMHFFRKVGGASTYINVGNDSHNISDSGYKKRIFIDALDSSLICVIWDRVNSLWIVNRMS